MPRSRQPFLLELEEEWRQFPKLFLILRIFPRILYVLYLHISTHFHLPFFPPLPPPSLSRFFPSFWEKKEIEKEKFGYWTILPRLPGCCGLSANPHETAHERAGYKFLARSAALFVSCFMLAAFFNILTGQFMPRRLC